MLGLRPREFTNKYIWMIHGRAVRMRQPKRMISAITSAKIASASTRAKDTHAVVVIAPAAPGLGARAPAEAIRCK